MNAARTRFDEVHARIHGHAAAERSVEVVSYRVRARIGVPRYEPVAVANVTPTAAPEAAVKGTRTVYFEADRGTEATIFERERLPLGGFLPGPAVVEQFDSTTVVPPGWRASVDGWGNLILEWEGRA